MKNLYLILLGLVCLGMTGCDKENEGCFPPVYEGFSYEPSVVYAGDSVFITAVQQKKGHYLNATDYRWSMTVQIDEDGEAKDSTLAFSMHTNYGGLDSSNPKWRTKLPANTIAGSYTCSFSARWSNSADGIGGDFSGGTGEGCTGSIISYSYTLYSEARGTFRLPVRRRQ